MAGRFFAAIVLVLLAGIAASAPVLANVARTSEATSGKSLTPAPDIAFAHPGYENFYFAPILLSVPACNRLMFSRCA